jgi:PKD repeat protein
MNPFGDGSDGALNVTSGTTNLLLDHKYQFTDVVVSTGATLSTSSTTGAVLYILATNSITINGAINVSNKVLNGRNTWSYSVDGVTYSSPGVANGADGASFSGQTTALSANGFGGGGGGMSITSGNGGDGGSGSSTPGSGGGSVSASAGTDTESSTVGQSGGNSSGGSGVAYAKFTRTSGTASGVAVSGNSGAGASAYGNSGADGSAGYVHSVTGTGTYTTTRYAGGGGGAGGIAGKSGVHVVLKAPNIILNGQIITAGSSGGNGGNGGRTYNNGALNNHYAMGGGGGGGGNGGHLDVVYSGVLTDTAIKTLGGGAGGIGGIGFTDQTFAASNGGGGSTGVATFTQIPASANFGSDVTSGMNDLTVNFTNLSQGGDTFLWTFGDGSTSTATSPSHVYVNPGTYTVSLASTNEEGASTETKTNYITVSQRVYELDFASRATGGGSSVLTLEEGFIDITSSASGGGSIYIKTVFQSLPQKDYEYRVFDESWNYLSTWENPTNPFGYSQRVNENASELNVTLARSPDNRVVRYDMLLDHLGATIIDENGDTILLQTETANSVGDGTDVRENLNVEVWAFYGGYDTLTDENGEDILDDESDPILTQFGAPNGKRVYSGYIADYELMYGETTGVNVVIVPHATEMSHYVFKDGLDTTVAYLNTDPVLMAREAMDNYASQGGYISYDAATMPLSGESVDYDFKLQTTRETVDKSVDLLPSGYYHFVDPGENKQYLLERGTVADHTFYYEQHITDMRLRKSITQLVNKVYFVGGETNPGVDLFKYYEDTASVTTLRPGLLRESDSRVSLDDSASILSNRKIAEFKDARWRTTVTISDAVYDIEEIKLGEMVGFKNFGTTTDTLLLQIVGLQRTKHTVTLELDMSLPNEAKRLEDLKKQILNEQIRDIGDSPT